MSRAEKRGGNGPVGHFAIHAYSDGWEAGKGHEISTGAFQHGGTFRQGIFQAHPMVCQDPDHTRTIFLRNEHPHGIDDCVHKLRKSAQKVRDRRRSKRDR